jgi:CIC family chloride channel protein
VVGMASMVAGTTGAVVTAITMLFEMTRDYSVILPLMLSVAISYAVRKQLSDGSIYTLKLLRRGHVVPEGLQCVLDAARQARHLMDRNFLVVDLDDETVDNILRGEQKKRATMLVVARQAKIIGVVPVSIIREGVTTGDLEALAMKDFIVVPEYSGLPVLLRTMEQERARFALVTRKTGSRAIEDIIGVISDEQIARTARSTAGLIG